jgi:hypothetical protein
MHRGARVGLEKERVSGGVRPRSAVASPKRFAGSLFELKYLQNFE